MGKPVKKTVAAKASSASSASSPSSPSWPGGRRFLIDGEAFDVEVHRVLGEHAEVSVNGRRYQVERARGASEASRAPVSGSAASPRGTRASAPVASEVRAPMAGKVLSVAVSAGGDVRRGQPLLVLDAMKMENTISATSDGEVAEIAVTPGDTVLQGALLVRMRES